MKGQPLPDLKVGKTTAVSFSTYVQRADQPKIYLTGSAFNTGMDKQVKDLRDKKIVEFKEDDVSRIALRGPDGDVGWEVKALENRATDRLSRRPNAVRLCCRVRNLPPPIRQRRPVRRRPGDLRSRQAASPAVLTAAYGRETRCCRQGVGRVYVKSADRRRSWSASTSRATSQGRR